MPMPGQNNKKNKFVNVYSVKGRSNKKNMRVMLNKLSQPTFDVKPESTRARIQTHSLIDKREKQMLQRYSNNKSNQNYNLQSTRTENFDRSQNNYSSMDAY